jgi:hypothetical protein
VIGGSASHRAGEGATEEIVRLLGLYEERYAGLTVKHFHEQMTNRYNCKRSYRVTRLSLQAAG